MCMKSLSFFNCISYASVVVSLTTKWASICVAISEVLSLCITIPFLSLMITVYEVLFYNMIMCLASFTVYGSLTNFSCGYQW